MPKIIPLQSFICKIPLIIFLLFISCAGRNLVERYQPVMGHWRTGRDIIMSIHMLPESGVAAVIKTAPGIVSEETKPGAVIIDRIKPLVDGGFSGYFIMPGENKPVRVRMMLSSPETLVIMSWDGRVRGNVMKWQRVKN